MIWSWCEELQESEQLRREGQHLLIVKGRLENLYYRIFLQLLFKVSMLSVL